MSPAGYRDDSFTAHAPCAPRHRAALSVLAVSEACSDGISFDFAVADACSLAGIGVCAASNAGTPAHRDSSIRFIIRFIMDSSKCYCDSARPVFPGALAGSLRSQA